MPDLAHSQRPNQHYFAKVFYQSVPGPNPLEEDHWYLFCFQDSVNWLENSQGAVNQKKLETIGELASGVAHDFNNLIMGIQSNAEAMLAQPSMTPQIRENLVNIIRACSTGASPDPQPARLRQAATADHDGLQRHRPGQRCHPHRRRRLGQLPNRPWARRLDEHSEPIVVVGSYPSLSHCLLNLIKNAREAMSGGRHDQPALGGGRDQRHADRARPRHRHSGAGPRPHLRAVFLDQEAGHRARPRHGARYSQPASRDGGNPFHRRHGHVGVAGLAARGRDPAAAPAGQPRHAPLDPAHLQALAADHHAVAEQRRPFPHLRHRRRRPGARRPLQPAAASRPPHRIFPRAGGGAGVRCSRPRCCRK